MSTIDLQSAADATAKDEYGCRFRRVLPWGQDGPSDNGMGIATVPPGGATEPHEHPEYEHFVITHGSGAAHVDGTAQAVSAGDVVRVRPGQVHHFENGSDQDRLEFICLWSIGEFGVA